MKEDLRLKEVLNDANRLRALNASRLLDSPREKIFDEATVDICDRLEVPMSLVTLIASDRQFFKSCIGLSEEATRTRGTSLEDSTCQYVVKQGALLVIEDALEDNFFRGHQGLLKSAARAYLGTPLLLFNQAIGSVCAVDTKPRNWKKSEIAYLEGKAHILTCEIARRRSFLF